MSLRESSVVIDSADSGGTAKGRVDQKKVTIVKHAKLASLREQLAAGEEVVRLKADPNAMADEAANPKNPLHPLYEWDDAKAAREQRVEHSRALLRSNVHVVWIPVLINREKLDETSPMVVVHPSRVATAPGMLSSVKDGTRTYTAASDIATDEARLLHLSMSTLKAVRSALAKVESFGLEKRYRGWVKILAAAKAFKDHGD